MSGAGEAGGPGRSTGAPGRMGGAVRHVGGGEGWEELCRVARANTWEAWVVLTERPVQPENPSRQHRLRGHLAERVIGGRTLPQWQYEVTAGGRIWYCPDAENRVVRVVAASPSHPKATE